jgi:cyclopropane-fatty-acyl-phospholipid synthase
MNSLVAQVQNQLQALPVPVGLVLPDGQRISAAGARLQLHVKEWASMARLAAGQIGSLAEDYVEGRIELDGSLRELMAVAAAVLPGSPTQSQSHWWTTVFQRTKSLAAHSRARDAAHIEFHYDVADDFYALWLDPARVYSCAYYAQASMSLAAAQEAKLDLICRKLMLQSGERLLDIGSGWGALILWAAQHYGVHATGITLSKNQFAYVNSLIDRQGLRGRVQMRLQDYRDLKDERFDKISSVGMFEHVGRANMTAYCAQIAALLEPGGLVLNHGITAAGLHNHGLGSGMGDFIEKYIFPGGELMHVSHMLSHMAAGGLEMLDTENLRPHYARTLWAWSDALEAQLPAALKSLEQSAGPQKAQPILRAYRLYLAGSAMAFEQGWIALHQMLAAKPWGKLELGPVRGAQSVYPFNREYMYPQH